MKPGNLSERKRCQIRRQTKDEDSILTHIESVGVRFFNGSPDRKCYKR